MRKIWNFLRANQGLAAIEFALIAPLLAFVVVALADAANFTVAFAAMQRAERAGVQYFMNGGTDSSTAQGIVTGTWRNPPSGYSVNATKVCKCGLGIIPCTQAMCIVGTKTITMTIAASATIPGMLMSLPESNTETIRVQ